MKNDLATYNMDFSSDRVLPLVGVVSVVNPTQKSPKVHHQASIGGAS